MKTKTCSKCGVEKEISLFHKNSTCVGGVRPECKSCAVLYSQNRYIQNKEKIRNKFKTWCFNYPWKRTYSAIVQRCDNPKGSSYSSYGGRGIKNLFKSSDELHELWIRDKAYEMIRPSIDRIDNDGNYCTENCRYIEYKENSQKARNSEKKVVLQFNLQGNFIKEWESLIFVSKTLNINQSAISRCCNNKAKSSGGFMWKFKI